MHRYEDLISLFSRCFEKEYNTRLIKGGEEPIYLPADESRPYHALYFARGFFASALHEISHWLIAGDKRRLQVDFGYWYEPDGRTLEQQALFESVEVKPQAMEWILSVAAGFDFRLSIDNINGQETDTCSFKRAVYEQIKAYCEKGLSPRANTFRAALCQFYRTSASLNIDDFNRKDL
jgi:elongation factor P hydroxylase